MHALEIQRNGEVLPVAGTPDALMLSLHLTAVVDGEHPASLHVGGMKDLGGDRRSHTLWLDDLPIGLGDEPRIVLKTVAEATPPSEETSRQTLTTTWPNRRALRRSSHPTSPTR